MAVRVSGLMEQADVLYRAAAECCRQHRRYAGLVDRSASDHEQKAALGMAYLCDDVLGTAITGYENALGHDEPHADDAWWHRGNMLWHASRKYIGRHASCDDDVAREKSTTRGKFGAMTVAFDLEASALLALKMALDSYRTARPEAV